jgi:hypothetical protein
VIVNFDGDIKFSTTSKHNLNFTTQESRTNKNYEKESLCVIFALDLSQKMKRWRRRRSCSKMKIFLLGTVAPKRKGFSSRPCLVTKNNQLFSIPTAQFILSFIIVGNCTSILSLTTHFICLSPSHLTAYQILGAYLGRPRRILLSDTAQLACTWAASQAYLLSIIRFRTCQVRRYHLSFHQEHRSSTPSFRIIKHLEGLYPQALTLGYVARRT